MISHGKKCAGISINAEWMVNDHGDSMVNDGSQWKKHGDFHGKKSSRNGYFRQPSFRVF